MRHKSKCGMSKRGISTVIASILVLAITVSLAVGLLTFGSSFMASQQKMQPPTTDQIKIDNVLFSSTQAVVTVRNIGVGNVTVTDVYAGNFHLAVSTPSPMQQGQTQTFTVSGTFNSGNAYTIKAATKNGGEATYTATYT
jgi:flagellin-like protein